MYQGNKSFRTSSAMKVEVRAVGSGSGETGRTWDFPMGLSLGISTSPEAVVLPPRAHWAKERDADP